jgi:preprotein translocase subunit SecF
MFEIVKPGTHIDFMKYRRFWTWFSSSLTVATLALFLFKGLNYGIDFTGGAEVQVEVPKSWDIGKVRNALSDGGLDNFKVQQIGVPEDSQFLIKAQGDESSLNLVSAKIDGILKKEITDGEHQIQRVDVVGPAAGSTLRMSGFLSMFYALIGITIYIALRFDIRYAPGAIISIFHDALLVIGVFILMQKQFDLQILAAILALIGFSNNDTIIIFDRIRETRALNPNMDIVRSVNQALNETLGRTILTTVSTFVCVFALWVFGGKTLEDFAFALVVGTVVGAYSSIFVASPLVISLVEFYDRREAKMKASGKANKKRTYTVRPDPKFTA